MPQDNPIVDIADGNLDAITGHVADGSTISGAQKGKNMELGEYKALHEQIVGIGERDVHLGLLLTDFLVRIAHLQGLDPAKELAKEQEEAEKEHAKHEAEIERIEGKIERDRAKHQQADKRDLEKLEKAEKKEARLNVHEGAPASESKKGSAK